MKPEAGHIVVVDKLPPCNFCEDEAIYDGKTIMGPWAYMCQPCWDRNSLRVTGVGFGQRLITKDQVTPS